VVQAPSPAGRRLPQHFAEWLAASPDGQRVRFVLRPGTPPLVFDGQSGQLAADEGRGLQPARQQSTRLAVTDWQNRDRPRLNGQPLRLADGEYSRSLAILPKEETFLLGTDTHLRLFDRTGRLLDQLPMPGTVWAVVAVEGMAVAALGDGTIRWFEATDHHPRARRPLRPLPMPAAGSPGRPEGLFDHAPQGGQELVGVHLNNGRAQTPEWASFQQAYRALYAPAAVRARLLGDTSLAQARMNELGEVRARIGRLPTLAAGQACAVIGETCTPVAWGGAELPAGASALRLTFNTTDRGLGLGPLDVMVNDRIAVRSVAVAGQNAVEVPLDPRAEPRRGPPLRRRPHPLRRGADAGAPPPRRGRPAARRRAPDPRRGRRGPVPAWPSSTCASPSPTPAPWSRRCAAAPRACSARSSRRC
jgi:hypothetical protein